MDPGHPAVTSVDRLSDDEFSVYARKGKELVSSHEGLKAYLDSEERGITGISRKIFYAFLGGAADRDNPRASEFFFDAMAFAYRHKETAPGLGDYLREALPGWEDHFATLKAGIDFAMEKSLNDDLVGPDPENPRLNRICRHRIYTMFGNVITGRLDPDEAMDDIMRSCRGHDVPVGVIMGITNLLHPYKQAVPQAASDEPTDINPESNQ